MTGTVVCIAALFQALVIVSVVARIVVAGIVVVVLVLVLVLALAFVVATILMIWVVGIGIVVPTVVGRVRLARETWRAEQSTYDSS